MNPLLLMPPTTKSGPPTDEDLRTLYDEVRRGFASESFKALDVRISLGADDLGAFIDQYRDDASQNDLPGYEPRAGIVATPSPMEKGSC